MTAAELLAKHSIKLESYAPGQHDTTCPQCSHERKKKNAKCLGVLIDDNGACWNCAHCGWTGPEKGEARESNGKGRTDLPAYVYRDADGIERFRKVRNLPGREPRFWLEQPDGHGGWRKGTKGANGAKAADTGIIYRADEVAKAIADGRTIACVEGEKDADNLWALGIAATCNAHGASDVIKNPRAKPKWYRSHSEQLRGADIVVFNDNDAAGYAHAETTAQLSHGIAKRVRRLDLAEHWAEIKKGNDVSDWLALGHTRAELDALIEQAPDQAGAAEKQARQEQDLPPPTEPMAVARVFVAQRHTEDGELTLRYWRGAWWRWRRSHWRESEPREVRSSLYSFTEHGTYLGAKGKVAWAPNRHKIGDLLEALSAICLLPDDIDQPAWLDRRTAGPIVAMTNGLLDIASRELISHSPFYFNTTAVPFDYDPSALAPKRWLAFLGELWPDDVAAIDALGEWFGYVISGRLDLHKILLMVGPTRGGKGAIARILGSLVGTPNVCGPTLNSLSGDFGLAPLIGKSLAVVADMRISGRDTSIVVERLLSISGEDTLTVNRKYRDQWTGKLSARFHVISNELPQLGDASAAIIGRFIMLVTTRTWLGREDRDLEPALQAELPGILNWALTGLQRLVVTNENRFTHVETGLEALGVMRDLASPVAAFVRDQCETGANKEVVVDAIYSAFKGWCDDNGHHKPTKQTFGRNLRAAFPQIRIKRPRDGEDRVRAYVGIALREGG